MQKFFGLLGELKRHAIALHLVDDDINLVAQLEGIVGTVGTEQVAVEYVSVARQILGA